MIKAVQVSGESNIPTGVTALVSDEWVTTYFVEFMANKITFDKVVFIPDHLWLEMGLPSITNLGVTVNTLDYKETRFEQAKD
jgi:hypothetical protein